MKELELLQQKLEQLLKQFSALQAEKERLEKAGKKQAGVIEALQIRITTLESELQLRSVAMSTAGTHSDEQKQKLKTHLDRVIREIEKNIELL